jgi:uncharacterized protein
MYSFKFAGSLPGFFGVQRMDGSNRLDAPGRAPSSASIKRGNEAERAASCGVAIMAKASTPGRTKTRLVPPLTFDQAAALNTAFLRDVAANVLLAGRHASIAGYVAFAPPGSEEFFRNALPPAIGLIEAGLPNLGACLVHTIEELFARGHACAVVLNSDTPTLPTALLVEAAEVLERTGERVVLGPASDGGYYLLGLRSPHRRLFEEIAWSTESVAATTLERARELGLDVHTLPVWHDVDDIEDLRRLHGEVRGLQVAEGGRDLREPYFPAAAAAVMRDFWADEESGDNHHAATLRAAAGSA